MDRKQKLRIVLAVTGLAAVIGLVSILNPAPAFEPARAAPLHTAKSTAQTWKTPFELPLKNWQRPNASSLDPVIEQRIDQLLAQMTLEQKVGQMTQGEIKHVSPADVERYGLGSVLSGGGTWPTKSWHHTVDDWVALADSYWLASQRTKLKIPVMWGIDAVHGHNNVNGATLFPHNIGLGAAGDVELVENIARATAKQVRATGLDWTFAPNLAVAQNPRWGRFYESFGQSPELVYHYSQAAVSGLQDNFSDYGVLATAKHFVADGAAVRGKEKGNAKISETELLNTHGLGYFGALDANVQVVMAGFNSWNGKRLTSHDYLLNDVLKGQMGFDGFVISDWDALGLVPGCRAYSCPEAINAGIDMAMVSFQWKEFIEHTVAQVENGEIPMSRIDDAVRRILRVKLRSGLFERGLPSERPLAGDAELLASEETRALARQAVRQSLVMLKNNDQLLPLPKDGNYLVMGSADNLARQAGGWSIRHQGAGGFTNASFGTGQTIAEGISELLAAHGGTADPGIKPGKQYDAAIVVLSERPHAEEAGDILTRHSAAFERQVGAQGLDMLERVHKLSPELPVVVVYLGGRPLWLNSPLNQSDAFVVAWLPGSEGGGVADGLFGDYAIDGKLPVAWPADDCMSDPANPSKALFPVGYGLTFKDNVHLDAVSQSLSAVRGSKLISFKCLTSNWL